MTTNFQPANSTDIPLLIELMREFYKIDNYNFHEQTAQACFAELIADESLGFVWLITEEGTAIGYIVLAFTYSLEYGGRNGFLDELYIEDSHRGKGVGTKAVKFVIETCRKLGLKALHLEVERDNQTAQALYRKNGFAGNNRQLLTHWINRL